MRSQLEQHTTCMCICTGASMSNTQEQHAGDTARHITSQLVVQPTPFNQQSRACTCSRGTRLQDLQCELEHYQQAGL